MRISSPTTDTRSSMPRGPPMPTRRPKIDPSGSMIALTCSPKTLRPTALKRSRSEASSCEENCRQARNRSEEHTSELPQLVRISYAVYCVKKNTQEQTEQLQQHEIKHETKQPN